MKKITQFFSKLNQKNNAREVKEINNTDYSGSEAAIVDNDAGILDITEALDKTILSTNNISSAVSIQNEIIHLISKQIVKLNLPRKYYAIICDETMDFSRKEMLALCLRQVDDSLNIHENFFGFYRAKTQNADSIFNLIKSVLEEELKLDLQLMVAQSFDGAATMAGAKKNATMEISIVASIVCLPLHLVFTPLVISMKINK
jgi:hypothetical protein